MKFVQHPNNDRQICVEARELSLRVKIGKCHLKHKVSHIPNVIFCPDRLHIPDEFDNFRYKHRPITPIERRNRVIDIDV